MGNVKGKKKIITEANIFRGIFCIYVLLIHCTGNPSRELIPLSFSSLVYSFINIAAKGAVPAFIFISGLTISYSYIQKDINILKFYKKRIKGTFIPYLACILFYYGVYMTIYNYEFSIPYLINRIVTGNMVYHLYFIVIVMQFYLVYPIICNLFKKYNNNLLLIIFFIIHIVCFMFIPMKNRFFGNYLVFFISGCYVAFNYEKFRKLLDNNKFKNASLITLIVATLYYIVELYLEIHFNIKLNSTNSTWQIFSLITIPGYYIVSLYIDQSRNEFIKHIKVNLNDISDASLEIYLMHPFFIIVLQRVLQKLSLAWRYLVLTIIIFTIAILYSKAMKYKIKKAKVRSLNLNK